MTDTEIKREIVDIIEGNSDRMPAAWIVQSVIKLHGKPKGDNADFYEYCAYGHVRAVVRSTLQHMRVEETEESVDHVLPGFERLQLRYIVENKGELQAVPIEKMTDAELAMKIGELERMAVGCIAHADELKRYRTQKTHGRAA